MQLNACILDENPTRDVAARKSALVFEFLKRRRSASPNEAGTAVIALPILGGLACAPAI
ncbi:hypothetical protein MCEREM21A_01170 [Sphingomonadaceae bacterium]|jgi:hypothetical protein